MTSSDAPRHRFLLPALVSVALAAAGGGGGGGTPLPAHADTDTATAALLAPAAFDEASARDFVASVEQARSLFSDEFVLTFTGDSLGLGLTETFYKGFPVVTVSAVTDPALASSAPELRPGAVVIGVGPDATSGIPLKDIAAKVAAAGRPVTVKFRDPSRYFELLDSTKGPPRRIITTSYLPANTRDAGTPEQVIRIERLAMPPAEERLRSSQLLDVMEIQYVAQLLDGDAIVDSSAVRAPPGTSAGSIYYVLGQRNGPPGKFPPGWDLTLRGMVVGEKRRVTLPSTLAYDRAGSKDGKIPPFATVVYTVKLVSLT